MIPQLAYRIQELAYGETDEATEWKIQQVAHDDISKGKEKAYKPLLGTKIVKEYKDNSILLRNSSRHATSAPP